MPVEEEAEHSGFGPVEVVPPADEPPAQAENEAYTAQLAQPLDVQARLSALPKLGSPTASSAGHQVHPRFLRRSNSLTKLAGQPRKDAKVRFEGEEARQLAKDFAQARRFVEQGGDPSALLAPASGGLDEESDLSSAVPTPAVDEMRAAAEAVAAIVDTPGPRPGPRHFVPAGRPLSGLSSVGGDDDDDEDDDDDGDEASETEPARSTSSALGDDANAAPSGADDGGDEADEDDDGTDTLGPRGKGARLSRAAAGEVREELAKLRAEQERTALGELEREAGVDEFRREEAGILAYLDRLEGGDDARAVEDAAELAERAELEVAEALARARAREAELRASYEAAAGRDEEGAAKSRGDLELLRASAARELEEKHGAAERLRRAAREAASALLARLEDAAGRGRAAAEEAARRLGERASASSPRPGVAAAAERRVRELAAAAAAFGAQARARGRRLAELAAARLPERPSYTPEPLPERKEEPGVWESVFCWGPRCWGRAGRA